MTHISLALIKLAQRSTLSMPPWELLQILFGLAIPFLLFPHIVNTRFGNMIFGINDVYVYELIWLWPNKAWNQTILLMLVWAHGCIGLHFWLRLTKWYEKAFPVLLSLAAIIPVLSITGFIAAGRETKLALEDPAALAEVKTFTNWPGTEQLVELISWSGYSVNAFYVLLTLALLVLVVRRVSTTMTPGVKVTYDPEPTVSMPHGATLLEASRMNGIPHLSVCGGRARCSTCRVEVLAGGETLPAPAGAEAETLAGINAGPQVRLACQLNPTKPITVNLLLRPKDDARERHGEGQGVERTLAVLFLDVRGFTNMSQDKLPYDVVFILNRLFAAAGAAIHEEGGWIDKYLGDGLMAVFGRDTDAEDGCRRAIRAARKIDVALDRVNRDLASELSEPLRIGIGLHVGALVLGEIGHDHTAAMTVIGRTVNAASRLELATKEMNCQFVMSEEAARMAGLDLSSFTTQSVTVRGLTEPLEVIAVGSARDLP